MKLPAYDLDYVEPEASLLDVQYAGLRDVLDRPEAKSAVAAITP